MFLNVLKYRKIGGNMDTPETNKYLTYGENFYEYPIEELFNCIGTTNKEGKYVIKKDLDDAINYMYKESNEKKVDFFRKIITITREIIIVLQNDTRLEGLVFNPGEFRDFIREKRYLNSREEMDFIGAVEELYNIRVLQNTLEKRMG